MNKHRDLKPLPTSTAEKKARIQWLLAHKVWTHPVTVPMPPNGEFKPGEAIKDAKMFLGEAPLAPGWSEEVMEDGGFYECVNFEFVYVDPHTLAVEDESRNTGLRVRLEAGPWHNMALEGPEPPPAEGWTPWNQWSAGHDIRLDCGSADVEELLLKLAALVECFYEEDGTSKDLWWCSWSHQECEPDETHFCKKCRFLVQD